jgi:hypothetical protein
MNPAESLIHTFQDLVTQVPEFLQPFLVSLAAAIPFVEGEGGTAIGVVGGLHPVLAGIAAAVGNFLAVLAVVTVSSRSRDAVVARNARRREKVAVGAGDTSELRVEADADLEATTAATPAKSESKGRRRVARWANRFGVPGASLLGPLAIPTHFTSAMLIAAGSQRWWVLLWQAVAILVWTTVVTALVWLGINAVTG